MAVRFAHLSDTHILEDPQTLQYGADTTRILEQAVPMVNALQPDFVAISGDLISDEREGSYRRLKGILDGIRAPIHMTLGNHDDRRGFRRVMLGQVDGGDGPVHKAFLWGGHHFLILDSLLPGKVEGWLDPDQLAWLDGELTAHEEEPTVIITHHPVLPIYIRWLDSLMLTNPEDLLAVLARHRNIRALFYGHVHQPRLWRHDGILFASNPALAFQFSALHQEPQITLGTPGFRLVEMDGETLRSALHYLDGRVEPMPDLAAIPIYIR